MLNSILIDRMSRFSRAVEAVDTLAELEEVFALGCHEIGAKMFSYHQLPRIGVSDYYPNKLVCWDGFPEEWKSFYKQKGYLNDDPLLRYVFERNCILTWHDILALTPKTEREADYLNLMRELNLGTGLVLPVFGPRAKSGVFSMGFDKRCEHANPLEISMVQWACQTVHYRYIDLAQHVDKKTYHLTPREQEILKLMAQGESNFAISETLKISTHTVNGYIKAIYIKLDVTDRVSASFRAFSHGLI